MRLLHARGRRAHAGPGACARAGRLATAERRVSCVCFLRGSATGSIELELLHELSSAAALPPEICSAAAGSCANVNVDARRAAPRSHAGQLPRLPLTLQSCRLALLAWPPAARSWRRPARPLVRPAGACAPSCSSTRPRRRCLLIVGPALLAFTRCVLTLSAFFLPSRRRAEEAVKRMTCNVLL